MLSANKTIMDNVFESLARTGTGDSKIPDGGVIYNTVFENYFENKKKRAEETLKKMTESINDDDDRKKPGCSFDSTLSDDDIDNIKIESHEIADAVARAMNECLKEISNQIDNHIKSMTLNINIPTLLPTIISPMGPCTGTLQISEATGAVITIS